MLVCVLACVFLRALVHVSERARVRSGVTECIFARVRECVCVCVRACVCACVCVRV